MSQLVAQRLVSSIRTWKDLGSGFESYCGHEFFIL